jgi:hypothetical protein
MLRVLILGSSLAALTSIASSGCTTVVQSGKCSGKATRCRTACLNAAVVTSPPLNVTDIRPGTRAIVLRVTDGDKVGRFAMGKLWLARATADDKGKDGKPTDWKIDRRRGIRLYGALDLDYAAIGVEWPRDARVKPSSRDPLRPGALLLAKGSDGPALAAPEAGSGQIYLQVGHPGNVRVRGEAVLDGEGLLLSIRRIGPFRFSGVWKGLGASGVFCVGNPR